MKHLLIFVLLLFPFVIKAQDIKYHIRGVINKQGTAKYVYLVRTTEVFKVVPIVNSSFEFNGSIDLGDELFKAVYLFFSERGNINYEEVKTKIEQGVWKLGYDANSKVVVLEDVKLDIETPDQLISAKIIEGGVLTKQMEEKTLAISQRKIPDFVKKNPDSPISLNVLQGVIKFYKLDIERAENRYGKPKELFALLSEKLQMSKPGMLLKKKIDEIYNP